jgi:hypothetical protein
MSIVLQVSRNFQLLTEPPQVEVPIREYIQRAERSGLPDGSLHNPHLVAPIGETIDKAAYRMSKAALEAWKAWTTPVDESQSDPVFDPITGKPIEPLKISIIEALVGEDKNYYTRIKRLLIVEEGHALRKEQAKVSRKVSESTNFAYNPDRSPLTPEQRYYEEIEKKIGEFGTVNYSIVKKDRCKGKDTIKYVVGVSAGDVKNVTGAPNYTERLEHINMSTYQTTIWRKPAKEEEDNYIPNTTSQDDPDYINPLCISSRNFVIYPPASRPYNAVYAILEENPKDPSNPKVIRKIYPTKGQKDYTSLSSMQYMLRQKNVPFFKVVISEVTYSNRKYPNCYFEPDLRVTYGEALTPDPNNYKKVDPDSVVGMKILQLLNEQPYLFTEYSWTYDGEDGPEKKVAVGFTLPNPKDKFGPRIYWVYLDTNKNTIGKPRNMNFIPSDKGKYKIALKQKRVHPSIIYKPFTIPAESLDYVPNKIPFIATVRVSDNYCYTRLDTSTNQRVFVGYEETKNTFFNILFDKGYQYVKEEDESKYSNVKLFHFIHKDLNTKEKRKQAFLSLTQDRK